ncbi:putative E3 ubiquitin-protein ligase ARI8 isoform X2 [Silene latifolia]|uniref:putative E3 ubiquitin-protein ligase ARI8 isoform X2 n=1 Tax=Silene latifolia TaxID=37657 RepID=UPI003D783D8F
MKKAFSLLRSKGFNFLYRNPTIANDDGINLDDWELIEVLDQEFNGEKDDDDDVDMIDLIEVDDPHTPFMRFAYHPKIKTIKYTILSKVDVGRILDGKISTVSTVLSLSRSDAIVLLQHFNWGVSWVHEEWLASEETVRKAVGLFERPVVETSEDVTSCSLCREGHAAENMLAVSCGHQICAACWTAYVSEAINDGPGCLTLRCPTPSCEAAVGIGLIELVSNQDDLKKFDDYLVKSYVAGSRKTKWCPAPGCEYAAVAFSSDTDRNNEVTCKCLHSFCWNCCKEAHVPIDCATVDEWGSEGLVQSTNWLLAKAKPCPNCEKLIEKVSCKRYSQCTVCNYVFRDDAFSLGAPGDEYNEQIDYDNDGMKMAAGSSLKRFNQYYDGWSCSEAARANAVTDYKVLKEIRMVILCGFLGMAESELKFLVEGHTQVVDSYRLLKWMYAYNYYQPEEDFLKRNLVEFMLEQAVTLVRMLEKHVNEFEQDAIAGEIPPTQFYAFRGGLMRLTRVTRSYFERLVEAMHDDLSEVVSISRASPKPNTEEASCSSPGLRTSPTRRVIKTEAEEGMSSPVVNMKSQVLIPGTFSQKDPKPTLKLD